MHTFVVICAQSPTVSAITTQSPTVIAMTQSSTVIVMTQILIVKINHTNNYL